MASPTIADAAALATGEPVHLGSPCSARHAKRRGALAIWRTYELRIAVCMPKSAEEFAGSSKSLFSKLPTQVQCHFYSSSPTSEL